jgi:hypothetical protein
LSGTVTAEELTERALLLAGAAVVLLVVVDRLKTVRLPKVLPRARRNEPAVLAIVQEPTVRYRRTPLWRRIFALGSLGVLSVVIGVILAVLLAVVVIGALLALGSFS